MSIFKACFILLFLTTSVAICPAQNRQAELLIAALSEEYKLNFCGERVPLDDQDVRERFEKELLLTLQGHAQIILWIKRSPKYLSTIEGMLKKHQMPDDLKYIAIIESALRPHATSESNAVGFWQFTNSSGQKYGLRIDAQIDERRSILYSTEAAIRYFKDLHKKYRSWTLAAAAYNMGENGLETEIQMQNVRDYYRLYLSLETQQYIFRALCAKLVLTNPQHFGYDPNKITHYPEPKVVRVMMHRNERTPIALLAQAADTHFKQIKDLNPEIRGYYLAPGRREILIPQGSERRFDRNLNRLLRNAERRNPTTTYIVKPGDNLTTIADKFNVSLGALLIWNGLSSSQTIHPGDKIVIQRGR